MQEQKIFPAYGMSKAEYAKRLQELEAPASQPSEGFFARFRKKTQ